MNDNITVLLEPTAACNLRCVHCYHAKTKYDDKKMDIKILSEFLEKCAPHYKAIKIIWHGGEPLLVGYDFFCKAYALFEKYAQKYNTKFCFGIQTNGTLLTQEYVDLFLSTNTQICISYDGQFNDILRQETKRTEEWIDLLQAQNVRLRCLSTISAASVKSLIEIYEYFKKKELSVKFNPIYMDGAAAFHKNLALRKEEWAENFIKLFDYWFYDRECNINMASCWDILDKFLGRLPQGCLSGRCMFRYLAIDAYGNIYPCGRAICDELLLGNISNYTDIREAFLSNTYEKILSENALRVNNCLNCKWVQKCHGGCNISSYINGSIAKINNFDCYFTRRVFEHIEKLLNEADLSIVNPYVIEIIGWKNT